MRSAVDADRQRRPARRQVLGELTEVGVEGPELAAVGGGRDDDDGIDRVVASGPGVEQARPPGGGLVEGLDPTRAEDPGQSGLAGSAPHLGHDDGRHRGEPPRPDEGREGGPGPAVVTLEGHEQVRDHAEAGVEGLLTVAGTKYTTARAVAARITDRLLVKLGRAPVRCRTGETLLSDIGDVPGAVGDARREDEDGLVPDTMAHLVAAYGSRTRDVIGVAADRPDLRRRVTPDSPVIGAELVWAAREEMALTLADAMIRRTPLGALGYPGDAAAAQAALLVGDELGWTNDRRQAEIAALRGFYALQKSS